MELHELRQRSQVAAVKCQHSVYEMADILSRPCFRETVLRTKKWL